MPVIEPPEIREPSEKYRIVEFYVDLGEPRPDIRICEMIRDWVAEHAAFPLAAVHFSYHRETDDEPSMLVGNLYVGEPLDVG